MSSRLLAAAVTGAAAVSLAACGSSSGSADETTTGASGASGSSQAFPVSIKHALGTTSVEAKPERIATVGWANHEVPLALGVVPVGMAKASYGDDDGDGVLPWVEEKLTAMGAKTPVLFDETDSIDFEAIADTQPDVILASYSGITKEDYAKLSEIAPTVAYPEAPWGTTMDEMIDLNATAMGMKGEGQQLVKDLDDEISEQVAKHPDLAGKSAVFASIDPKDLSQVGFYTDHDPRVDFFKDLGMTSPTAVKDASAKSKEFYATISAEQADRLDDADVIVTYGTDATRKTAEGDPLLSKIPAVERGSMAIFEDGTPLAASANPSPLSIPWGLDDYLSILDKAAAKAT